MARITINHKTLDFTTGINIHTPELWNPTLNRMNTKRTQAIETNNTLALIEKKLEATYTTLYQTNTHVTVEMVRDAFHGKNQDQYTLLTLFDKLIKQKKALAKTIITQDTVEKYQCTKKKVQHYLQTTYKQKDIHIKEVNYDFIHNYEIYLLSDGGCGHNTMVRHMRYLKQVITDALKCNYITRDPFYNITLSSKRTNPKYLTETELAKILHTPFQNKILEQTRDIFIFCSLTGLSYIDVKHLTPRHIITDQNGKEYIIKDRKKTGNQSFIPLLSQAKQIIEKYLNTNYYQNNNNQENTNNTIFPVAPCQCMNRYLKEIAALCGIDKNLTSHCGRHTCATLMLTKGVSIESVSKMLGHTDIKTTQIYAKILNEKVQAEISEVESKLNLTLTTPNPQNQAHPQLTNQVKEMEYSYE